MFSESFPDDLAPLRSVMCRPSSLMVQTLSVFNLHLAQGHPLDPGACIFQFYFSSMGAKAWHNTLASKFKLFVPFCLVQLCLPNTLVPRHDPPLCMWFSSTAACLNLAYVFPWSDLAKANANVPSQHLRVGAIFCL